MSTQEQATPSVRSIAIDDIRAPDRTEKLHPIEKEITEAEAADEHDDVETWEEFKESVGTHPDKTIDVRRNGQGFELIDGDRRLRAVEENGGEEIDARIFQEMSDEEFYIRRVRANEHRKDSDPEKQAWYAAQFTAPWLLPPGERKDLKRRTQTEYGQMIGRAQGTVSRWLNIVKDQHMIRAALGEVAQRNTSDNIPSDEDIDKIDQIVDLLKGRGDNKRVVARNNEGPLADELIALAGDVSLGELLGTAEKAAEDGWGMSDYLEYLKENFVTSDEKPATTGEMDSGLRNSDSTQKENRDGNPDRTGTADDFQEDESSEPGVVPPEDTPGEAWINPNKVEVEVDWTEYVDDDDLPGDESVTQLTAFRSTGVQAENDVSVAMKMLEKKWGMTPGEVLNQSPLAEAIVDFTIEEFAE